MTTSAETGAALLVEPATATRTRPDSGSESGKLASSTRVELTKVAAAVVGASTTFRKMESPIT